MDFRMITIPNKYVDVDKLNNDILEYTKKAMFISDIFFIINRSGNILKVTDNVDDIFSFLNNNKKILESKSIVSKYLWVEFLETFLKETNKYKTYRKFTCFKYFNTLKYGNKTDKIHMEKIKIDPMFRNFLRTMKLNRILDSNYELD
jgi:hypothetical protein